ncbi:hypothetical protein L207DRAFT_590368 [Hyaloscypha variabilis F]|uniref:Uncharacterized protein n=1 Tax=Hyaloscypha variabilis (strain UAMH 11265 / GT02V1 / F) TaxID=1149755 RepID=A0A2J6R2C3_HYAVF|nr:hypothetical protein L207DRAFT_590368 [Hyaloscypha variabilis F]
MASFAEEQLRSVLADLKTGVGDLTSKLNATKLDVSQYASNNAALINFETRAIDLNRNTMELEESDTEIQGRKWRLHPEVYKRDVLRDLQKARGVKAELDQLFRHLDNFKTRALYQESIHRMGKSSLEMLNIAVASAPEGNGTGDIDERKKNNSETDRARRTSGAGGTNGPKEKKFKVEKTVHVKAHERRRPQRKPKSNASKN